MPQTTFANTRGIAHKKSGGQSLVFPDVCRPPTGPPVPFPNLGRSADTTDGPPSVTTDGAMPMVKRAKYARTTGDEPGVNGGIISGTHRHECEFLSYSFDVFFEGRNVCRLGDPLWHNRKNIAG
jgi:hypothetical protein